MNQLAKRIRLTIPPAEGPLPRKTFSRATFLIRLTLLVLVSVTGYSLLTLDYGEIGIQQGLHNTILNFKLLLTEPQFNHFTFREACYAVLVTIGLALLTTIIGAIIALFFGLLAARNLSNPIYSNLIKPCVAFIRAVPTVLWVLIFAVSAGLGSVAAVVGMTFHSVGYLIKAYSESFEEMDEGVIEALKGSGASWWQIVFQAVIPSSMSYLISWTFMRFEINFAAAIAMGAAAGAGGIGFDLFMASNFYLDLREVGVITYFVLIFAVLLETLAIRMKAKIKKAD
ncbi:MAG: ABC transporter permease subunit [Gorillibacterium sp.]|nr:ABC transporter permease subunit [Gorillibacterium sp.]